jgi:hypothetical protein
MKKIEMIKWMILPVDTLKCMICGEVATRRVTILDEVAELNLCLCAGCTIKPASQIIQEAIYHD